MYDQFDDEFEELEDDEYFDDCDPEKQYGDPLLYDDPNDPKYYDDPDEYFDDADDTSGDKEELQEIAESSKLMMELGKPIPDEIADDKEAVEEYTAIRIKRYEKTVREMLTRAKDMTEALQCIQKSLPARTKLRTSMTKLVDALSDALDDFEVVTDETGVVGQFVGLNDVIRNTSLLLSGFMEIKQLSDEDEKHEVAPINLQRIAEYINKTRAMLKDVADFMSTPEAVRSTDNKFFYSALQPKWSVKVTKAVDDVVRSIVDVSNLKTATKAIAKIVSGLNEAVSPDSGETIFLTVPDAIEVSERIIPTGMVCAVDTVTTKLVSKKSSIGTVPSMQTVEILPKTKHKPAVMAKVMFSCADAKGVKIGGKISQYESLVNDAVCTLYEAGNADHTMTTEMILETMSGKKLSGGISPKQSSLIDNAMRKLASTRGYVDYTEYAQRKKCRDENGNDILEMKHGSTLLNYDDYILKTKGKDGVRESVTYRIKEEPLLLKNAHFVRQIATIPRTWYNIREVDDDGHVLDVSIPDTKDRASVKQYIVKTVNMMQSRVKRDRKRKEPSGITGGKIRYSTIFNECGFDDASKMKRSRMKGYIRTIFANLKAIGVVESWTEYPSGKRKEGISYKIK